MVSALGIVIMVWGYILNNWVLGSTGFQVNLGELLD